MVFSREVEKVPNVIPICYSTTHNISITSILFFFFYQFLFILLIIVSYVPPGIGYGMVIISGIVCIYYNIIITWTFYYMFKSMSKVLPWSICGQYWNSVNCVVERSETMDNSTMLNTTAINSTLTNVTELFNNKSVPASEEFWE